MANFKMSPQSIIYLNFSSHFIIRPALTLGLRGRETEEFRLPNIDPYYLQKRRGENLRLIIELNWKKKSNNREKCKCNKGLCEFPIFTREEYVE